MELSNLINFFRDCYEADNAPATIWNIFQANVEHRIFADSEEQLLTGLLEHAPIDAEKGMAAASAAFLYRKEKELTYCSLFVVGRLRLEQDQEPQVICSPLLMYPAEILEIESNFFLKPGMDNLRLNYLLLDTLQGSQGRQNLHLTQELTERLTAGTSRASFIPAVAQLLEDVAPGLDSGELFRYPHLIPERELREAFKTASTDPKAPLRLLPCSVAALVKKSVEARGVLNELLEIAQSDSVSTPIRVAFGTTPDIAGPNTTRREPPTIGRVPAVLSAAQKQVLESAATKPLTLVIGPRGRGNPVRLPRWRWNISGGARAF